MRCLSLGIDVACHAAVAGSASSYRRSALCVQICRVFVISHHACRSGIWHIFVGGTVFFCRGCRCCAVLCCVFVGAGATRDLRCLSLGIDVAYHAAVAGSASSYRRSALCVQIFRVFVISRHACRSGIWHICVGGTVFFCRWYDVFLFRWYGVFL